MKCPECTAEFQRVGRQVYCTPKCTMKVWQRTHFAKNPEARRGEWRAQHQKYRARRLAQMKRYRETTPWKFLLISAKARAAKKKLPFQLTEEWARSIWTGRCALTDIEFAAPGVGSGPKVYSPSIDRIVPAAGYTAENCRFILWAVNALKHTGSDADMLLIARKLVEKHS